MNQNKPFNLEDRLVEFAVECVSYAETLSSNYVGIYYRNQLIRSSGSSALNYGEAQGATSTKEFTYKAGTVLKELKETRTCLKILDRLKQGDNAQLREVINEVNELVAIIGRMISNKKQSKH